MSRLVQRGALRRTVNSLGYRLSADCYAAFDEVLGRAIAHAIFYTKPAKTIRATDVLRILATKSAQQKGTTDDR